MLESRQPVPSETEESTSGVLHEEVAPLAEAIAEEPRGWGPRALRRRFRAWRRSRPFWAGFWAVLGSVIITFGPASAIKLILVSGTVVWLGMLIGILIGVLGLFLWFAPVFRHFYSILIVLLALVSLITSDLGGFLIGMTLAIVGGSMGFAWTDDERFEKKESKHRLRRAARRLVPHRRPVVGVSGAQ